MGYIAGSCLQTTIKTNKQIKAMLGVSQYPILNYTTEHIKKTQKNK
jgi:hypothetical protein